MIIRHLRITNFRKYTNLELDFPDGVIGVVGRNGSGKSTLLEVFAWLLYGSNALKTRNIQIFPDFIEPKGETSGEMSFEIGASRMRIERGFRYPNKSTATLYIGDKVLAVGTREVSAEIEKLTGMDWKAFQTSFYTRQNELNLLGSLQVSERGKRLEEMLGLEKTRIIIDNIKGDLRSLQGEIKGLEQLLPREAEYKQQLAQKTQEYESISLKINTLSEHLNSLRERSAGLKESFTETEKKRESFLKIKSDLALREQAGEQKQRRLDSLDKEITEIESGSEEFKRLKTETEALPELLKQVNHLEQEQLKFENAKHKKKRLEELNLLLDEQLKRGKSLAAEIENLQKNTEPIDIINNNIKELDTRINRGRDYLTDQKAGLETLEKEINRLRNQMRDIDKLGSDAVCSFCLRPFGGEMDSILAHFREELTGLEHKRNEAAENLSKAEQGLKDLYEQKQKDEKIREKAQSTDRKIAESEGERKNLRDSYKTNINQKTMLEKELEEIGEIKFDPGKLSELKEKAAILQEKNTRYSALNERMRTLSNLISDAKKHREDLVIINDNIAKLKSSLEALNFSGEKFTTQKKELEKAIFEVEQTNSELFGYRERAAGLSSELGGLNEQLKNIETSKTRIGEITGEKIYLESLIELLKELKIELASRIRPMLSEISSRLLEMMTDGKFTELDLNENYDISIRDYGELRELVRFSGGEQDLANLCLRLSISKLLAQSSRLEAGFLILDEVFGSQDNFRKENIIGAISGLQDFFRQIFMVTHVDDIKDAVQTLITVEENPDGSSSVLIE